MYILTFWILNGAGRNRRTSYGMMLAGATLLISSTAFFGLNITRLILGIVVYGPRSEKGVEFFFADVTETSFIIKSVLENLQTIVFDAIFRCWEVWNRWWVAAGPALGWLGIIGVCCPHPRSRFAIKNTVLTLSIGTNQALFYAKHTAGNIFDKSTGRWITGIYVTTLIVNLSATGLLALRIYLVHRKSVQYLSCSNLKVIMRIVLESGAIYSAMITCGMITFVLHSRGVYVIFDMLSPTMSIAFNLIIVRIGFISDERLISRFPHLPQSERGQPSTIHFGRRSSDMRTETYKTGLESRSLAIELTQYTVGDDVSTTGKAGLARTLSEVEAGTESSPTPYFHS
ncbi:hypothetical protein BXZ70DRAFT_767720 [Cristinia sonorae]|uniref:Uncharacterized protein n=1 Tax=Cristinia sonorae TaxID=1940300 RepID=A0A8K0XRZ9_9AGAR|nr:hypothetical protein BXZ70DRAFT_767720 [Cristinia sonorae]